MGPCERYRIDDLLLDVGVQRVTRGQLELELPKLSFDLLLELVRTAPNVQTIDNLMSRVWPGLVVSPETISQRVKLLRKALGDDAQNPRYIAGLRGRGYHIVPPVRRVDHELTVVTAVEQPGRSSASAIEPVGAQERRWRGRRMPYAFAAIALVLVISVPTVLSLQTRWLTPRSVEVVGPRTIAVLPFENLSRDPESDFIAQGLAETVLNRLANERELMVIARASAFAASNQGLNAVQIARRLNVRYLVDGTMQRSGARLRVMARLVDTERSDTQRTFSFESGIDDVFSLQDEISSQIAAALNVTPTSASHTEFGLDAQLAYLKGRKLLRTRHIESADAAALQFERAIRFSPQFASAYTSLAEARFQSVFLRNQFNENAAQLWTEVSPLLARAIELDPGSGEPYYLRAKIQSGWQERRSEADADFKRGLELSPGYAPGLEMLADHLFGIGLTDDALRIIDRARQLDPLAARNHYLKAAILWSNRRAEDEAAAFFVQALQVEPDFYPAHIRLAQLRWQQGRLAEAIKHAESALAIEPKAVWIRERLVWLYVDLEDIESARDVTRAFEHPFPAANALLCYHAGDFACASTNLKAAFEDANLDSFGLGVWFALGGIVEQAAATGDYASARKLLTTSDEMTDGSGQLIFKFKNARKLLMLARVEKAAGNPVLSADIARQVLAVCNENPGFGRRGESEFYQALALAMLERRDESLAMLEQIWAHRAPQGWWAVLQRPPFFDELQDSLRFQTLVAETRAWLPVQRAQIEQMRLAGTIPRRPAMLASTNH